ncbi:MAG: MxaK protein [Pseudomonadota bacterium]|nr:MxaK protein [Pseudomonadota bacterium]
MKRRAVHAVFATLALVCGGMAAYQGVRLAHGMRINDAIRGASASELDSPVPESRFARALALSHAGKSEEALKEYTALAGSEHGELRRRALYNLGNLYLHDALKDDEAFRSLALVELAKRNYRILLREAPSDWDARYNLERALWLAPESEQIVGDDEPPERDQAVSTLQGARIDLP